MSSIRDSVTKILVGNFSFSIKTDLCNQSNLVLKITITGSLGHIRHPLTLALIKAGHQVTVITNTPKKKIEIEALGVSAAIARINNHPHKNFLNTIKNSVHAHLGQGLLFLVSNYI